MANTIIKLSIDCDGEYCGNCNQHVSCDGITGYHEIHWCSLYEVDLDGYKRCQACLDATIKDEDIKNKPYEEG